MKLIKKIFSEITKKHVFPKNIAPNPRDTDIYLVSYPRSGNTWMRYLLHYAIWPDVPEPNLGILASYIPSVNIDYDCQRMLDPKSPCNQLNHRIIKTHTSYDPIIKNVIYIVRDGRDVLVSYWHFCNQRDGTNVPFDQFLEKTPKGSWGRHVLGWLNAPLERKLVLRYEDMYVDTESCLRKALRFAEISCNDIAIAEAVKKTCFESLKMIEQKGKFNPYQDETSKFFHKGEIGSWRKVFKPGDLEKFRELHGGPIPEIGYLW